MGGVEVFSSQRRDGTPIPAVKDLPELKFAVGLEVQGAVLLQLMDEDRFRAEEICQCWFDPRFVAGDVLHIPRTGCDGVHKDKHTRIVDPAFAIRLDFDSPRVTAQ